MTPTYWPTKKEKPFVIAQLRVTLLKEEIHRDVFSIIELEIALDNKVSRLAVNHSYTPNRIFLTIIRSYKSMCAALTSIIISQIAILKFKKILGAYWHNKMGAFQNPRKVRLYQFLDWPVGQDTPTSLDSILQLLDHVGRWEEHSGFYTTTFVCK